MRHEKVNDKEFYRVAKNIVFKQSKLGTEVVSKDTSLTIIGSGRSAFVFKLPTSNLAIKVFYPPFEPVAEREAEIYRKLEGVSYFPTVYSSGENYIVMDYIKGLTLFQCLVKGIRIRATHIEQIDKALLLARERGLNPSDIHLHNILITNEGEIKIIDVARFYQKKKCSQWSDIKSVFYKYYTHRFFPKKIPGVLLYFIASLYKKKLLSKLY